MRSVDDMAIEASVPLIALVGPTASGKSALAHHLALTGSRPGYPIEVISVDAIGVYRGMEIGTASPTPAERNQVRYHLVSMVEPTEDFSVTEFQEAFAAVRADLGRRSAVGILVGGTGLYHRVVIDDLRPPGRWPEIRAQLEADLDAQGAPALHARLTAMDPVAAARMEPNNARRVVRALEVCLGSGRPFSSFGPGLETYPQSPVVQIGLRWPMPVLAERITARVQAMIAAGWQAEVENLLVAGELSRTARQAVGYAEILELNRGSITMEEAVERITLRTRQLAVRQTRWFRRDPRIRWVDVESDPIAEAAPLVRDILSGIGTR